MELTSLYLPKKDRKSNGYLSLKSEKKPFNLHKIFQHDETINSKRLSKKMYNFLKIWHVKERKKNFFFRSIYMKMNWTFNYLKVMRRINQSSERKKERQKKKKRKKERRKESKNIFFHFFFFLYVYVKMNWSFIYLKVTRRISQSSDSILILSNRSG